MPDGASLIRPTGWRHKPGNNPSAQPRPGQAQPPPGIIVTSHFDDILTSRGIDALQQPHCLMALRLSGLRDGDINRGITPTAHPRPGQAQPPPGINGAPRFGDILTSRRIEALHLPHCLMALRLSGLRDGNADRGILPPPHNPGRIRHSRHPASS